MWRFIGQVVTWMVLLAMAAVLTAAVLVPRIAGATPYTVTTGSMRPTMPPGTLAVVRPTPVEEISIGDVVTYQLRSGDPTVVTHRVVGIGLDGTGETVLQTQGDANAAPDRDRVRPVQVRGTTWYAVPHLGRVNTLLDNTQRQWAVSTTAALLLGYAVVLWAGAARDRARSRRPASTSTALEASTSRSDHR